MNSYKRKWIAKGIFFGAIFFALITLGTMYLWNNLLVNLFGLPEITYLQTLGLMLIGRLLTGGFGHRGGHHRRRWGSHHWRKRWQNMSEEQRKAFMERSKGRWENMSDEERRAVTDYCGGWWPEEEKNNATEEQK
jgi:hypothetical protein